MRLTLTQILVITRARVSNRGDHSLVRFLPTPASPLGCGGAAAIRSTGPAEAPNTLGEQADGGRSRAIVKHNRDLPSVIDIV